MRDEGAHTDEPRMSAIAMMRNALDLLDGAGEALAAVHLQQAIEVAARTPVPSRVHPTDAWRR